jgi:hypothetical protein
MTAAPTRARPDRAASATASAGPRRWLLFVHQLPARPTSLRVRVWRRLQQMGAIAVKQAAYVLPDTPSQREDFEWLKTEIEGAGAAASVFAASLVDRFEDDALVDQFRASREAAYGELARDAERLLTRIAGKRRHVGAAAPRRALHQLRERLAAAERVDFFGGAGRDRVLTLVGEIESLAAPGGAATATRSGAGETSFAGRVWVTRPRPGVDRMASAWLIRRFVDSEARFDFVPDRAAAPPESIPFDMFGVEFTHRGARCTFEILVETFGLDDPALRRVAAIVHDLDLKDGRFGAADAPAIGRAIDGLRLAQADDHRLLADGMTLFEALYLAFAEDARASGPRPLARRRAPGRPKRRPRPR